MKIPYWDDEQHVVITTSSASDDDAANNKEDTGSQLSVCFAPEEDNVIHETIPRSEYSAQEIQDCWYTRAEYNAQKRHALETLSLNRTLTLSPNDPEHTMRGLECRTRECSDSRRFLRYRAAAAVFDQQARQFEQGLRDPEALSEAYHEISWHSMYDAHTQGMADEQDAQVFQAVAENPKFFAPQRSSSARKSNVLSKIISIERSEPEVPSNLFLGMDCKLHLQSTPNSFNLNSFFNDLSIGVAAA